MRTLIFGGCRFLSAIVCMYTFKLFPRGMAVRELTRFVLVLTSYAAATWAHPLRPQPVLSQPRGQPAKSTAGDPIGEASRLLPAATKADLLAQAKPANRVTDIAAGCYSGVVAGFLNCVVVASIVFAPVGLPQMIGVQHALVGFVVTQLIVTRLTGVSALITVPSNTKISNLISPEMHFSTISLTWSPSSSPR